MSAQLVRREIPPEGPRPKMAFGNSVNTLIDVYSNCISLLKAFKRRDSRAHGRRDEYEKQQALLRKSLKSDRARVRRAYSSAVSEAGSRFERGDDRARSALSRVLRKLKAAITNILRSSSTHQQPALDYESLMLLSNTSRAETIRTFDQLSRRLGGSTSSRTSAVTSTSSTKRRSGHSSSGSTAPSKTSARSSKTGRPEKKPPSPRPDRRPARSESSREGRKRKASVKTSTSSPRPPQKPLPGARSSATDTVPALRSPTRRVHSPRKDALLNRISFASIATDSTKLGEIPQRKWTSRYPRPRNSDSTMAESDDYNVAPVFPLRPYEAPVKERRFLGLFRRRS